MRQTWDLFMQPPAFRDINAILAQTSEVFHRRVWVLYFCCVPKTTAGPNKLTGERVMSIQPIKTTLSLFQVLSRHWRFGL